MQALSHLAAKYGLKAKITCPHCWTVFPPEDIQWIAAHEELRGDPMLAEDYANNGMRFSPSRFDAFGNALDAKGFPCDSLACPSCHLVIPRGLTELETLFISILGSPGCGKSYYLASLIYTLRQKAIRDYRLEFSDLDPAANQYLNRIEEALFLNPNSDDPQVLGNLIAKTEMAGRDLYDEVRYGGQTVRYPRPYLFVLRPEKMHANATHANRIGRAICLYDNAGEHFLAGEDSVAAPVTRHLAKSKFLLFLFDPTQDARFWKWCEKERSKKPESADNEFPQLKAERQFRQETLLHEAAARVRKLRGLTQNDKHNSHLIIIVTKSDLWADLLPWYREDEPTQTREAQGVPIQMLDTSRIMEVSKKLRSHLEEVSPDLVNAAENFCTSVTYIPISALGKRPFIDQASGKKSILPKDIEPRWVTVPLIHGINQSVPGLFGALKPNIDKPKTKRSS
ncbi:MAG: hypothetical protein QM775_28295 [Pirellulales bacterium]